MNRRIQLSAVAAGAAMALLVACGSSSPSNDSSAPPKTELTSALHTLTSGSTLTTTLSLDTTGAKIIAIGRDGNSTGGPTLAQANIIAAGQIAIETQATSGKLDSASAGSDAYSISLSSGSTTYAGIRLLNHTIYVQVDLKDILAAAGQSSEFASLQAEVASFPPFVTALISGKWVALPLSTVASLESLLNGASHNSIPGNSALLGLAHQLATTLLGDLTVTRVSTGSTDHLAVSGNLRTFAQGALTAIVTAIPALASTVNPAQADTVPDSILHLDAYVTGGALSKATLDIGQFSMTQKFSLPIVATFARSGDTIAVPAGATSVDFADLISLFETASGSSSSSGSGSSPAPVISSVPVPSGSP